MMSSDTPSEVKASPEADTLFRLDIKGDRQNLAYQSLQQASIPKYRPAGRGNVIGLDKGFRILKSSDTGRNVVASSLDSGVKQRQHFSALTEPQPSQLLRAPQAQKETITNQLEYVALTNGRSRKRRRLSSEGGSNDESGSEDSTDDNLLGLQPTGHDAFDDSVYQRQRELAGQTSKRPDDIDTWRALLDLQADLVRAGTDKRLTTAQQRTVSELKISISQEALSKAKDLVVRNDLSGRLMTEGSKVWDRSKQRTEWNMLIKQNPSFDIHVLYLNYLQTDHVGFSYDGCIQAYRDWLQAEVKSDERNRDRQCLYVLLRLTNFMKQPGYGELATAVWQSMMELNLYRPASIPKEQALNALEDFWDTESTRFGESGAKGWSSASNQHPMAAEDPASSELQNKSIYNDWYLAEKTVMTRASLPARTLDNTSADDPYRVVLFSDIKDFLFELSSKESEHLLMDALLWFCGRPPVSCSSSGSLWQMDPFLSPTAMLDNSGEDELLSTVQFTGVTEVATLLTSLGPFSALSTRGRTQQLSLWSCRGIEQLALSRPHDEHLGVYAIAQALQSNATTARKFAKRLIKQNADSVNLYNVYALVESTIGNQATAKNVWQTTIVMKAKFRDRTVINELLLWRSWVSNALRHDDIAGASALLQSMSLSPNVLNEPIHHKTGSKQAFARTESEIQPLILKALSPPISSEHGELLVLSTDLLAMLRYCQSNGDLGSAIETYHNVLEVVGNTSTRSRPGEVVEKMHQHRTQLIHLHLSSNRGRFEPKQILQALQDSVRQFPNNSIFVTLHDQYQRRYGLMDRLRGVAAQALSEPAETLTQLMQNIHREMSTSEDLGTTEHSIRAAFNRANHEESVACHCPRTRLAHVRWEINLLNKQTQTTHNSTSRKRLRRQADRAIQALHAAIRACPWVKELYLLAFESEAMREALGPEGLKQVYETMLERGLRVHVDISDRIEKHS